MTPANVGSVEHTHRSNAATHNQNQVGGAQGQGQGQGAGAGGFHSHRSHLSLLESSRGNGNGNGNGSLNTDRLSTGLLTDRDRDRDKDRDRDRDKDRDKDKDRDRDRGTLTGARLVLSSPNSRSASPAPAVFETTQSTGNMLSTSNIGNMVNMEKIEKIEKIENENKTKAAVLPPPVSVRLVDSCALNALLRTYALVTAGLMQRCLGQGQESDGFGYGQGLDPACCYLQPPPSSHFDSHNRSHDNSNSNSPQRQRNSINSQSLSNSINYSTPAPAANLWYAVREFIELVTSPPMSVSVSKSISTQYTDNGNGNGNGNGGVDTMSMADSININSSERNGWLLHALLHLSSTLGAGSAGPTALRLAGSAIPVCIECPCLSQHMDSDSDSHLQYQGEGEKEKENKNKLNKTTLLGVGGFAGVSLVECPGDCNQRKALAFYRGRGGGGSTVNQGNTLGNALGNTDTVTGGGTGGGDRNRTRDRIWTDTDAGGAKARRYAVKRLGRERSPTDEPAAVVDVMAEVLCLQVGLHIHILIYTTYTRNAHTNTYTYN